VKPYINRFLSLVVLCLSLTAQAGINLPLRDGSTIELYDKSYALLIGVSDYEHWPDLPGVEEDIEVVGRSLKKHGFKVISLLNPTRSSFDNTMRDFIGDHGQDPENRLIVYYAGHGYTLTTSRGRELGYIVPADAPLPKDGTGAFKKKAISMLEIEIFAKQMESKHAMFTFDSCFSGSLFEITRAVPDAISLKTSEPVRQFITAGSAEQTVPDKSVFRNQFVAGLEGEADVNKDGFITGTELAQYIEESVTNYTRRAQTPQYGKIRDPYLDKGDFVFINPRMEITINVPGQKQAKNIESQGVDPAAIELSYWDAIKINNDPEAYQAYLAEYPEGQFSKLASLLIKQVGKQEEKARALKQEREAGEQKLAVQRQRQEEFFLKQRQELAEQQSDAKHRMVEFKKEQVALALQREKEEARLQLLLKQQKGALELQMTSVSPNYPKRVIKDKKIALGVWYQLEDPLYGTAVTERIGSDVEKLFKSKITSKSDYSMDRIVSFSKDTARSFYYDSRENTEAKKICEELHVDSIYSAGFLMGTGYNSPDMEYVAYDCVKNQRIETTVSVEPDNKDKGFDYENSISKGLQTFFRDIEEAQ